MAIEKEINLNVNSNIEGSIGQLKALKKELKGVDVGTEEFKKLYNQIDDLEDKIKSAKNKSSDWIDSLEQAGGPIGLLGASINKAKVATQSFGGALKATGIGLVVSLVAGLAAAFNDNEKAQKKLQPLLEGLQKIFAGVFAVVEPLFNTLVDLAVSALPMVSKAFGVVYSSVTAVFESLGALGSAIKKLLSGDFSGAWKDAKSSVTDFGKHYDEANKRFEDGSKELTKTQKDELDKRKEDEKKHQEELAKNRKAANEKATEERKRIAEEKKKEEEDRRNAEQSLEKKYLDDLQNLNAKTDQEKLDLQKQRDLDEINKLNTTANEKANLLALFNEKYATLQTELDDKNAADKKAKDDKNSADKKAKDDKTAQEDIDRAKLVEDAKKSIQDAGFNNISNGLGLLKGLFEKNKGLQKALLIAESAAGIAKIIVNTQAANAAARLKYALLPGGAALAAAESVMNKVSAGIGIAANIAGTAKALSALGGGGAAAAGSGDVGGGGGGASAPSAPSFNVVGNGGANQIAGVMANQNMPPIKTYVVANDVTTQQGLDNNIKSNATLG
jgi:hypothetical protein